MKLCTKYCPEWFECKDTRLAVVYADLCGRPDRKFECLKIKKSSDRVQDMDDNSMN
jgi:hypothetical protein